MRHHHLRTVSALLVLALALGACGQRPRIPIPTPDRHGNGTADSLPPECEGDAEHCVVLTTYQGVRVFENVGHGGICTEDGRCRYPRNRYGSRWQCVELFNRFFALRYGAGYVPGDAGDLFTNAAGVPGLELHPDGGDQPPVPGDALVFTGGPHGHVAIVVGVGEDAIDVVEQNGRGDGTNRYPYDRASNRVLTGRNSPLVSLGWIHARANPATSRP